MLLNVWETDSYREKLVDVHQKKIERVKNRVKYVLSK